MIKKLKMAYELQLFGRALLSKKTSKWAKIFAGVALLYAISPVDIIPDFLPVIGIMDDVAALTAAGISVAHMTKALRKEWRDSDTKS